jgi:hypothetical protein
MQELLYWSGGVQRENICGFILSIASAIAGQFVTLATLFGPSYSHWSHPRGCHDKEGS